MNSIPVRAFLSFLVLAAIGVWARLMLLDFPTGRGARLAHVLFISVLSVYAFMLIFAIVKLLLIMRAHGKDAEKQG